MATIRSRIPGDNLAEIYCPTCGWSYKMPMSPLALKENIIGVAKELERYIIEEMRTKGHASPDIDDGWIHECESHIPANPKQARMK